MHKPLLTWLLEDATAPGPFTSLDRIYAWLKGKCRKRPPLVEVRAALRTRYEEVRRYGQVGYLACPRVDAEPWTPPRWGAPRRRGLDPATLDRIRSNVEWCTPERVEQYRCLRRWRRELTGVSRADEVMYMVYDALGRGIALDVIDRSVQACIARDYTRVLSDAQLRSRLNRRYRRLGIRNG